MARIGIDMGHAVKGSIGAVGILTEHVENRKIGNEVISLLKSKGHTVVNCSCDEATSSNSQLSAIVQKANAQPLDVFCSIHLNAGGGHGTETYVYTGCDKTIAKRVNDKVVASCGFRNRGVKEASFHVLKNTVAPALLVEVCFVDSQEDSKKLNTKAVAKAIAEGIINEVIDTATPPPSIGNGGAFAIGDYNGNVKTTDTLNVRAGRGTEHVVIDQLSAGQVVKVMYILPDNRDGKGDSALWGSIMLNGKTGYIHLGYTNPVSSSVTPTPPPAPKKEYVNLPPSATGWNVYPTNKAPVVGNQCGRLAPSQFGGLSYEILGKPQANVFTIQTSSFGKVNIYAGSDTSATFTSYAKY